METPPQKLPSTEDEQEEEEEEEEESILKMAAIAARARASKQESMRSKKGLSRDSRN
jgi:hypothetical protein